MDSNELSRLRHNWHVGINKASDILGYDKMRFMYDAKDVAEEWERLPYWFAKERTGTMPQLHRQCSHSSEDEIVDNHLTCCLGVECRKCEFLLALDAHVENVPPEEMDKIKAQTCIAHIMTEQHRRFVDTTEGMILTAGDRMFWDKVYASMSAEPAKMLSDDDLSDIVEFYDDADAMAPIAQELLDRRADWRSMEYTYRLIEEHRGDVDGIKALVRQARTGLRCKK